MCGRFYIDDETAREIEKIARKIDLQTAGTGDVYPSQPALILKALKNEMVSQVLQWGYERAGKNNLIFNARAESVQEKPMFRYDYETHRCIIPVKKFYEWKKSGAGEREKYDFFVPDEILFLAGIYHKDPGGDRFTILTREAEGCMTKIHDRMPLILKADDMEKWLFSKEEAVKLLDSHFEKLQRRKSGQEEYVQMCLF
ncbi:MAG: SOS response-associated peptidase [Lachnospiraceae bacterium]|nr:SOS response-associated peptidase [Lachnospiraceae bacterium]